MKKILIIGSGGREHVLGWKIKQSKTNPQLYFAPGNGGTEEIGKNIDIKATDLNKLLAFAKEYKIDLTVVGPEDPLALGIVDLFEKNKLMIFGPDKAAARLESSKVWAVKFMEDNNILHPRSMVFDNFHEATKYVVEQNGNCVVKTDGLSLGKGVYVCSNGDQAKSALQKIMIDKIYGDAGQKVVIQEKLIGREVSVMAFCDGKVAIPIVTAQDYKRVYDHDLGPNTGGMGGFASVTIPKSILKSMHRVLSLVVERMHEMGTPYVGTLYGGFMIVGNRPYVLEFNCRLGDPETQVQLPLLKSDLVTILEACIKGNLTPELVTFTNKKTLCVVLASGGYPDKYEKGHEIKGLNINRNQNGLIVFHAGTKLDNNRIITNGGRVLGVTAIANSFSQAYKNVYSVIGDPINFEFMQYRKDIGKKSIE